MIWTFRNKLFKYFKQFKYSNKLSLFKFIEKRHITYYISILNLSFYVCKISIYIKIRIKSTIINFIIVSKFVTFLLSISCITMGWEKNFLETWAAKKNIEYRGPIVHTVGQSIEREILFPLVETGFLWVSRNEFKASHCYFFITSHQSYESAFSLFPTLILKIESISDAVL